MPKSRIPMLSDSTEFAARKWFVQMHKRGLLFHPDDSPCEVIRVVDGKSTFTQAECEEVAQTIKYMFLCLGDAVYEQAFDVLSRTFHTPAERKAMIAMNS